MMKEIINYSVWGYQVVVWGQAGKSAVDGV